jgi:hypothetical protein
MATASALAVESGLMRERLSHGFRTDRQVTNACAQAAKIAFPIAAATGASLGVAHPCHHAAPVTLDNLNVRRAGLTIPLHCFEFASRPLSVRG